jgi:hypothetical protein
MSSLRTATATDTTSTKVAKKVSCACCSQDGFGRNDIGWRLGGRASSGGQGVSRRSLSVSESGIMARQEWRPKATLKAGQPSPSSIRVPDMRQCEVGRMVEE